MITKNPLPATRPIKTNDELGYDLDDTRPAGAVATQPQAAPAERLPTRKHDGFPALELSEQDRQAALKALGISTPQQNFAIDLHVRLDMRRAYTERGHVNLIRTWTVWSEVPRADWASWLDVEGRGGIIELWLSGLTAHNSYVFEIVVSGWRRNSSSAYKVNSSAGFHGNFAASPNNQVQYLYGILQPISDRALVRLAPIEMNIFSFYHANFYG